MITYYYEEVIRYGDYYSMYEATKRTNRKKENIKGWLQLVAQVKSVSKAMEQFVEGTLIKNTNKVIKGSRASINNYMSALSEIGLNPVTIPKDWKIKKIRNPLKSTMDYKTISQ